MPKKEYTSLPNDYPVCEHSSCHMAAAMLASDELLHSGGAGKISASD